MIENMSQNPNFHQFRVPDRKSGKSGQIRGPEKSESGQRPGWNSIFSEKPKLRFRSGYSETMKSRKREKSVNIGLPEVKSGFPEKVLWRPGRWPLFDFSRPRNRAILTPFRSPTRKRWLLRFWPILMISDLGPIWWFNDLMIWDHRFNDLMI